MFNRWVSTFYAADIVFTLLIIMTLFFIITTIAGLGIPVWRELR